MRKVSAHNHDWCSVSVFLEGHSDAQVQFLRWLKRSTIPHLEVTDEALATLRKAGVIKARAPIGTLVLVHQIKAIAELYNSRNPKHRIANVLDGLVWKETIVLNDPPAIKNGKEQLPSRNDESCGEAETKKVKEELSVEFESRIGEGDECMLGFLGLQEMEEPFSDTGWEDPTPGNISPTFALANTPTWIVYTGGTPSNDDSVTLQSPYQVQKIARSEDTTSILLPAMPSGIVVSLVINETTHFITVASEEVTNVVRGELK